MNLLNSVTVILSWFVDEEVAEKAVKGQAVSEPSNGKYCSRVGHHWEESKGACLL